MKNLLKIMIVLMAIGAVTFISSCKKDKDDGEIKTAAFLYFTAYSDNTVSSVDLVNSSTTATAIYEYADGITGNPTGIGLTSDGYLIFTEESGDRILKAKADGTGTVTELYVAADGVNEPTALTVDNATGKIYWCNSGSGQVMNGKTDGSGTPTAMFGGAVVCSYAYGIAIDRVNSKIYFADFDGYIKKGALDGSGTPVVLWDNSNSNMYYPSNICIDPDRNKIYWTDEYYDNIMVGTLDGTGTPTALYDAADGIDRADAIAIDVNSNLIYWSETNNNVIARAKLDGTGSRQVLITGIESYAMVLEFR